MLLLPNVVQPATSTEPIEPRTQALTSSAPPAHLSDSHQVTTIHLMTPLLHVVPILTTSALVSNSQVSQDGIVPRRDCPKKDCEADLKLSESKTCVSYCEFRRTGFLGPEMQAIGKYAIAQPPKLGISLEEEPRHHSGTVLALEYLVAGRRHFCWRYLQL